MDEFCGLNESDDLAGAAEESSSESSEQERPRPARRRRRTVRVFDEMESAFGGERGAKAFVWRGPNMVTPDVALVKTCGGVGLCATREFGKHETVFVEEAAEAVVLNDVSHCPRCLRSMVRCDSWDVPATCCGVEPVSSSSSSVGSHSPAEKLAAQASNDYDYLCGDANSADALGLSTVSDSAGKMALNCFELHLVSPFQAYHRDLVRKHGRGTREIREALQKFADDNGVDCSDDAIRDFAAPHVAALFTLTSCINHDCEPNCQVVTGFLTPTVELTTLCHILPGQQLTISYIPGASTITNTERRRKRLKSAYLFDCACDRCCCC